MLRKWLFYYVSVIKNEGRIIIVIGNDLKMKTNKIKFILVTICIAIVHFVCSMLLFGYGFALGDQLNMSSSDKILSWVIEVPFIILGFPLTLLVAAIGKIFAIPGLLFPLFMVLNSIVWGICLSWYILKINNRNKNL